MICYLVLGVMFRFFAFYRFQLIFISEDHVHVIFDRFSTFGKDRYIYMFVLIACDTLFFFINYKENLVFFYRLYIFA